MTQATYAKNMKGCQGEGKPLPKWQEEEIRQEQYAKFIRRLCIERLEELERVRYRPFYVDLDEMNELVRSSWFLKKVGFDRGYKIGRDVGYEARRKEVPDLREINRSKARVIREKDKVIEEKDVMISTLRAMVAGLKSNRFHVHVHRGVTCGDNGGLTMDGYPCGRSRYLDSYGRCKDH